MEQEKKNEGTGNGEVSKKKVKNDNKDKLEQLKRKQKILQARITQMEAREKTLERKQDVRRKILLGAYFLDQAVKGGTVAELYQRMDKFLVRNSDRVLFGLAQVEVTKNKTSSRAHVAHKISNETDNNESEVREETKRKMEVVS